jgi:AcrR family transcriptional regulator
MGRDKPYHHGNLREVLLESAIRLIAEVGPAGFNLRELARRAGVSHNAPYRHFRDRDDLIAAAATQGFRELTQAMLRATEGEPRALNCLKRAGLAYINFALRRPEHFTVMFDGPTPLKTDHPDLAEASEEAFGTLVKFVKNCQDEGHLPSGNPHKFALLAWSMVHGVAKLASTGRLPYRSKTEILKFAEFVIDESLPGRNRNPKTIELDSLDALPRVLIQARIAAGLTQEDLAARLGVKPQQIQRYEASDYQAASFARLREIARLLGLRVPESVELLQK